MSFDLLDLETTDDAAARAAAARAASSGAAGSGMEEDSIDTIRLATLRALAETGEVNMSDMFARVAAVSSSGAAGGGGGGGGGSSDEGDGSDDGGGSDDEPDDNDNEPDAEEGGEESFALTVFRDGGPDLELTVVKQTLIVSVKAIIQHMPGGLRVNQQRLIYRGVDMEDDCTLGDYDILHNGCRIWLALRDPKKRTQKREAFYPKT
eukprot:3141722-Heterocapsa_arctica.AAC.1